MSAGILEGYVIEIKRLALRSNAASATADKTGVVIERPILPAVRNFPALRVDSQHAATGERSDIGMPGFIEGEIPRSNRAAPISQDAGKGCAPLRPVLGVIRIGVIGAAFGPVHFDVGIGGVNSIYPLRLAYITVPCDGIAVPADIGRFQFAHGPAPQVVNVINQPNLRLYSAALKAWTECRADAIARILHPPHD